MYNRYVRNDQGIYTRIPEEELTGSQPPGRSQGHQESRQPPQRPAAPPEQPARPEPFERTHKPKEPQRQAPPPHDTHRYKPPLGNDGLAGTLRNLLNRFHLESVDTGDLLLLLLLLLLFKEDADEELLFAFGLLLIL